MDGDIKWLIGIGVTISIALGSILIGAFYKLAALIRRVEAQMKDGDDQLHGRINRVREDTVHKTDLDSLSTRLSKDLHEIRDEQRSANNATNQRLDALLSAIANRNDGNQR